MYYPSCRYDDRQEDVYIDMLLIKISVIYYVNTKYTLYIPLYSFGLRLITISQTIYRSMIASVSMHTLTTKVSRISFKYDLDGEITPLLSINPSIQLEDNDLCITKIAITHPITDLESLAAGDTLKVFVPESKQEQLRIELQNTSSQPRIDFAHHKCPVCQSPLFDSQHGIGKCLNRDCPAQFSSSLLLFLSSLGLALHHPIQKVLDSLLVHGAISTFAQLFYLTEMDICSSTVSMLEAQTFIHYIHSIRGHVSLSQLFTALRIPGITPAWSQVIESYFQQKQYNPKLIAEFLNKEKQKEIEIDWTSWNEFFSLDTNRRVLCTVAEYLFN